MCSSFFPPPKADALCRPSTPFHLVIENSYGEKDAQERASVRDSPLPFRGFFPAPSSRIDNTNSASPRWCLALEIKRTVDGSREEGVQSRCLQFGCEGGAQAREKNAMTHHHTALNRARRERECVCREREREDCVNKSPLLGKWKKTKKRRTIKHGTQDRECVCLGHDDFSRLYGR